MNLSIEEIEERIYKINIIRQREAERLNQRIEREKNRPKGLNGKGETRRNEKFPMRVEKDFKTLLAAIATDRKEKGLRFSSMTDVVTAAVKEYALTHYPDLYNEIYKQTII